VYLRYEVTCSVALLLCQVTVLQSYGINGTRSSMLVEGFDPLTVSQRSVFCFQPMGDLMTRKVSGTQIGGAPHFIRVLYCRVCSTVCCRDAFPLCLTRSPRMSCIPGTGRNGSGKVAVKHYYYYLPAVSKGLSAHVVVS
jgi:hypothetical protein